MSHTDTHTDNATLSVETGRINAAQNDTAKLLFACRLGVHNVRVGSDFSRKQTQ